MALSQPHADYTSALASGMIEDYLVVMHYYNSGGNGQIGLSLNSSATISVNSTSTKFTPAIMNVPTIREKIDLKRYRSSLGNITLTVADFPTSVSTFDLTNSAGLFSGEFWNNNGNRFYINQKVEIFSMLNNSNDISKCLKIFEGRLADVQQNYQGKTVKLQITAYNPFDHISIPTARDNVENTPAPITYGAFTPNAYNAYATSVDLWKAPVLDKGKQGFVRALLRDTTISADAHPHIWDDLLEKFIPIGVNVGGTLDGASEAYNGINISFADQRLFRLVKQKPIAVNGGTNMNLAFDSPNADDTSTNGTTQLAGISATGTQTSYNDNNDIVTFDLPQFSGRPTSYTITVVYKLRGVAETGVNYTDFTVRLNAKVDDTDFSEADVNSEWNKSTNELTITDDSGEDDTTSSLHTQNFNVNVATTDGYPTTLSLRTEASMDEVQGTGTMKHQALIYDIRINATCAVDVSQSNNNLQSGMREILGIDYLYCGADGYTASWDSSAITTIVDMHRDLVYRFGGVTATPANWSTVDSARSNYTVQYSTHEIQTLQSLLDKCAFEGQFIFRTDCQGNYKYINPHPTGFSATSISGGSLVFELSDINNISFKMSPISDVITKIKANYNQHPATEKWQDIDTFTNTTARTNYNFGTLANENTQEINFHMLNATNGISDWKTKYFDRFGEPRMVVQFDVLDPKFYYLEVGDTFQFNSNVGYFFNQDVGGDEVGFLITETKRTIGKITVTGIWLGEA
jgi:hypothetical protein